MICLFSLHAYNRNKKDRLDGLLISGIAIFVGGTPHRLPYDKEEDHERVKKVEDLRCSFVLGAMCGFSTLLWNVPRETPPICLSRSCLSVTYLSCGHLPLSHIPFTKLPLSHIPFMHSPTSQSHTFHYATSQCIRVYSVKLNDRGLTS